MVTIQALSETVKRKTFKTFADTFRDKFRSFERQALVTVESFTELLIRSVCELESEPKKSVTQTTVTVSTRTLYNSICC